MTLIKFTQTNMADANANYRLKGTASGTITTSTLIWWEPEFARPDTSGITLEAAGFNPNDFRQVRMPNGVDQIPNGAWRGKREGQPADIPIAQWTANGWFIYHGTIVLPEILPSEDDIRRAFYQTMNTSAAELAARGQ
jgi:hypothetical protein